MLVDRSKSARHPHLPPPPQSLSSPSSPPSSPSSPSSHSLPRKSPTKSTRSTKSPRPSSLSHSRSSSVKSPNPSRFSFPSSSSSHSRSSYSRDPDTHPLNLHSDELRRLSAMAAARDEQRSSMDIDSTPKESTGANGGQRSPTPPPHRSSTSTAEADSFKLAGNKFFKDGNYSRAIEEFTKGVT